MDQNLNELVVEENGISFQYHVIVVVIVVVVRGKIFLGVVSSSSSLLSCIEVL